MTTSIFQAVALLQRGGVVVFPTDTVWGVGVAVAHAPSPRAVARAKGRPSDKPIAWLIGGVDALDVYGAHVPDYARNLAYAFWPGALTLVVNASDAVPDAFRSPTGSVGLRMPAHLTALELIQHVGAIATSSANMAGEAAVSTVADLDPSLLTHVDCVLDASCSAMPSGQASTVVDCTGAAPVVLREGAVVF